MPTVMWAFLYGALVNKNINSTIFVMVTQKDNLGCGVASTAYVLGISYEDFFGSPFIV